MKLLQTKYIQFLIDGLAKKHFPLTLIVVHYMGGGSNKEKQKASEVVKKPKKLVG